MKCLWPQVLLKSHTDSFTDFLQNETEELVQNLYGLGLERGWGLTALAVLSEDTDLTLGPGMMAKTICNSVQGI